MKVIINHVFGGFQLSPAGLKRYQELSGDTKCDEWMSGIGRNDKALVQMFEELGDKSSSSPGELKLVEIPDDVAFVIEVYDGREWIAEQHRTWQ